MRRSRTYAFRRSWAASPVTMVPDGGMSFEMEKYMHTVDPSSGSALRPHLEVEPGASAAAASVRSRESDPERAKKLAELLYDQGLLMANLPLEDPTAYTDLVCRADRLSQVHLCVKREDRVRSLYERQ